MALWLVFLLDEAQQIEKTLGAAWIKACATAQAQDVCRPSGFFTPFDVQAIARAIKEARYAPAECVTQQVESAQHRLPQTIQLSADFAPVLKPKLSNKI